MNIQALKETPKDLSGYVEAKDFGSISKNASNLRELVQQGTSNISAIGFPLGTIFDLEEELNAAGYTVFMVVTPGLIAFGDFYLKKF